MPGDVPVVVHRAGPRRVVAARIGPMFAADASIFSWPRSTRSLAPRRPRVPSRVFPPLPPRGPSYRSAVMPSIPQQHLEDRIRIELDRALVLDHQRRRRRCHDHLVADVNRTVPGKPGRITIELWAFRKPRPYPTSEGAVHAQAPAGTFLYSLQTLHEPDRGDRGTVRSAILGGISCARIAFRIRSGWTLIVIARSTKPEWPPPPCSSVQYLINHASTSPHHGRCRSLRPPECLRRLTRNAALSGAIPPGATDCIVQGTTPCATPQALYHVR